MAPRPHPAEPAFSGPLRIGTRGSPLALAQTEIMRRRLLAACPGLAPAITVIRTTGDRVLDRPLAEIGGKGLFTKEIDEAMLAGRIDIAVHSIKDLPTWLPDGIVLAATLPREDPRDAFVSAIAVGIDDLPAGASVGTASLRRQAQLLAKRPDLIVVPLRGNVATRLDKVAAGIVAATFLAIAGLKRLGLEGHASAILGADEMLPAVGQAAIAHHLPGRRCADAGLAGGDRRCPHHRRDRLRAGDAGGSRWLLPHADRRPRPCGCRRQVEPAWPGRPPGRQPPARRRAHRPGRRRTHDGRRRGRGVAAPRRPRLLRLTEGRAMRLLITRPHDDAQPLAAALRADGIDSLIEPLLTVLSIAGPPLDLAGVQALLATSANGVRAFAARQPQRDLPILAVGDATARAARSLGFAGVESAGGDVDSLAALVRRRCDPAAGRAAARRRHRHRRRSRQGAGSRWIRRAAGRFCTRRGRRRALSAAAIAALREHRLDGVVLYSPRTARTLARLIEAAGIGNSCRHLTAFCISAAVAEAIGGLPWRRIARAATPDQPALLAAILAAAVRT